MSPISVLIRWFPDRRGMAAGMAIMGFGGGAIIAVPVMKALLRVWYEAPHYLGSVAYVGLTTEGGRRFAEVAGELREVVVVGAADAVRMTVPGPAGVYVVGGGNTGAAATFFTLGAVYLIVMIAAAFRYRVPREGWVPRGWTPPARKLISRNHVHVDQALKTPQFWMLWIVLGASVVSGMGVIGVAATVVSEIFGAALPETVNGAFVATYVLMISVFNMLGRFFWASASDFLGRKTTYHIFFGLGIALYLSIPFIAKEGGAPAMARLAMFCVVTMVIFTMYGGGFATIPAYLADIFGDRYVGAIHGRLMTVTSLAAIMGPLAITGLRQMSLNAALHDLAAKVDPERFRRVFGAGVDQLDSLIAAKTATVSTLMEIAPRGVPDPSPGLYDTTMSVMAGLLAIGFCANVLVHPVHEKHHVED